MKKKRFFSGRLLQFLLVCALIAGDVSVTFSQQTVQAADFTDESSDEESSSTVTEEESTDDFSSGGEDSFDSEEESEAEIFGDSAETESEEETEEGLRYIKGRPLTDEEEAEQLAPFATLTDLDPGVELVGGTAVPRGYSSQTSYAETYDSRDLGLVTSVKNQGSYGICWAFSMASILETSLLAQGMGSYDLSEEHLAYFFANRQNDPLGNTAGDVNYHDGSSYYEGGNALVGSVFLSTWSGMATESVATLGTSPDVSTAYDTTAYLKDAVFSDYTESVMKALLTEYYSVSIMYYADTSGTYYNADTAAYCYGGSTGSVNHVVTVVGWDDTYEAANFADESGVTSDGAWIVKNSWGSSWGDEGYFYLSYEDPTICSLVAGTATTDPQYENNYFYDGSSGTNYVNLSVGNKLAVVFEATAGSGCMETLGEVTVTTYSDSNSFSIQVYTNLTDESVPTSGTAAYSSAYTYTQSKAGVDTISIPEVTLQQGTTYSIVVTNVGSGKIAFGYEATGSASWYSWVAATAENQSFIYSSGSWTDAVTWKECSFRIKAHTTTLSSAAQISLTNSSLSLDAGTTASIGASITPSSAQSGGITYTSGDTAVATVDSSGTVTGVGPGTTTITCVATGNSGISATCQVTVTLATPTLQVSSSSYNQVELSWTQVSGCEGYLVYRKVSGGSWTRIAKAAGTSTLTYTDSSVTVGTTYSYRIRAYVKYTSGNVYSAYASAVTATPSLADISGFQVSSSAYNKVSLGWSQVSGCEGYLIYRKTSGGSWTRIAKVTGASSITYTDSSVTVGTTYSYRMRAYVKLTSGNVYSAYASAVTATPSLAKVTASAQAYSGVYNTVTWNKVSGAQGYVVYRKAVGGSWKAIKIVTGTSTFSWNDTTPTACESYYYAVRAYRTVDTTRVKGSYAASDAITTSPKTQAIKSATSTSSGIRLTWTTQSCAGYRVYRKTSGGSWARLKIITSGSTSTYTDTTAKTGTTYIYAVRAYVTNSSGNVYSKYTTKSATR